MKNAAGYHPGPATPSTTDGAPLRLKIFYQDWVQVGSIWFEVVLVIGAFVELLGMRPILSVSARLLIAQFNFFYDFTFTMFCSIVSLFALS